MANSRIPAHVRFLARIDKRPDGCWIFLGCNVKGYGCVRIRDEGSKRPFNMLAHRFSYEHFVGPIPEGMDVLHSCDVPRCVNPAHLSTGSASANLRDMALKNRGRRSATGLPYGVSVHTDHERERPYQARVWIRGISHSLGYFSDPNEAAQIAADFKVKMLH